MTGGTAPAPAVDGFEDRSTFDGGALVDIGPVEVWCHDTGGRGEPIVLVGGFTAGHFAFDLVRPYLAGRRLITWEPRGLGPSSRPDPGSEPYSAAVWADDLRSLLRALDVGRAHVWAGGFGSYIALRFAAEHPDAVGGLVTYTDVWAGDEHKGYAKIWDVFSPIVRHFGTRGFGARVLANVFDMSDEPWFGRWEAQNVEDVVHADMVEATIGYGLLRADVRDDLRRIRAPTLVVQGDRTWDGRTLDPRADPSLTLMRERIADLELLNVPGAHPGYALVQQPETCVNVVLDFLARHPLD